MQKLTLPIHNCKITAGYKSVAYRQSFGFGHYGQDLIDRARTSRAVYGMGNGIVVACGMDGKTPSERLGNCVVVVYNDVALNIGEVKSLAGRMFHLDSILVKTGDTITPKTILGLYGNTGAHSNGAHLHIEFDTDVQYPTYAYGIAASGSVIKRGTVDSTVDPAQVFFLGEGQAIFAEQSDIATGWVGKGALELPRLSVERTYTTAEYNAVVAQRDALDAKYTHLTATVVDTIKNLEEVIK